MTLEVINKIEVKSHTVAFDIEPNKLVLVVEDDTDNVKLMFGGNAISINLRDIETAINNCVNVKYNK